MLTVARKVNLDDLVGAYEIAQRLGLRHPENVHYYYRQDESFPKPVAAIGGPTIKTLIWLWSEVEAWAWSKKRFRPRMKELEDGKEAAGGVRGS